MTTTTEPKPTARGGHRDNPLISDLLEDCTCLWQQRVKGVGMLTAYSTASGCVFFLDFQKERGWMMLTECPSGLVTENVAELGTMIAGSAKHRGQAAEPNATTEHVSRPAKPSPTVGALGPWKADHRPVVRPGGHVHRVGQGLISEPREAAGVRAVTDSPAPIASRRWVGWSRGGPPGLEVVLGETRRQGQREPRTRPR
jgi:hypothetical protein